MKEFSTHSSGPSRVAWVAGYYVNITLEKFIFLYFLTHFNLLDLCLWLRGGLVLDFWLVALSRNTSQQISRDNFGILQALKLCLVKAGWFFTACR